ncbi:MAG: hypothetical protein E6I71_04250 [Chloroflexi bacterium]|nr:MAG: hypothetical protein E6I71_04250 [Chloroflexota bacterium]
MSELERELEQELHRVLDAVAARPIPLRRAVHPRVGLRALVGGAGAALAVKVLTGVAVAAAAVTVAGAATTGSLNPAVWGQAVSDQVVKCKQQVANSSQHGIGDCVSSFASQHGAAVSSAARHNGNGNPNGNGQANGNGSWNGNGNANGHSKDKSKDHTAPPKTSSTSIPTFDPEPIDQVNTHPPVTISPEP